VKDDTGCLLYPSAVKTAQEIARTPACAPATWARASTAPQGARDLRDRAIRVAKDPRPPKRKTQWSVQDVNGGLWRDRIGSAWVDAFNDSVWIYSGELAEEAVRLGFDEVQFDYVRFPDEPRERLATAIFAARRPGDTQRTAVARNVRMLKQRLAPLGAPVTFDIFGLTASATGTWGSGRCGRDFITSPMSSCQWCIPVTITTAPTATIAPTPTRIRSCTRRYAKPCSVPKHPAAAQIRPYLQAFTLGRRLPRYTPFEIREQIRAAEDLGIHSWVLWNPRSVYQRDALRPYRPVVRKRRGRLGSHFRRHSVV